MSSKLSFREAKNTEDYLLAWPLILELNPDLTKKAFWQYQKEMTELGNYWLLLGFSNEELIGVCGYWIATKFYTGKYLEIDNFIISSKARSQNYGAAFIDQVESIAKKESCEIIMLDAYLQNTRGHTFYERNGFDAKGFHFLKSMK